MRRIPLLEWHRKLYESGSASDFPYALGNTMRKVLLDAYNAVPTTWRNWVKIGDLADFKTYDRIMLGKAEPPLEVTEEGHYEDSQLSEWRYQIALKTYGRDFTLSRKAIINDDLGAFRDFSGKQGEAMGIALAKYVVQTLLEGNANTYDGVALFHASSHVGGNNLVSTALSADLTGMTAVETALLTLMEMTDEEGEKMGVDFSRKPGRLVVPTQLSGIAKALATHEQVTDTTNNVMVPNRVRGLVEVDTESWLTSSTAWYVIADPSVGVPPIEIAFLGGKQDPDLLVKTPEYQRVRGGGTDPWSQDLVDDIKYRSRHDWGGQMALYQGSYKSTGTG